MHVFRFIVIIVLTLPSYVSGQLLQVPCPEDSVWIWQLNGKSDCQPEYLLSDSDYVYLESTNRELEIYSAEVLFLNDTNRFEVFRVLTTSISSSKEIIRPCGLTLDSLFVMIDSFNLLTAVPTTLHDLSKEQEPFSSYVLRIRRQGKIYVFQYAFELEMVKPNSIPDGLYFIIKSIEKYVNEQTLWSLD